jgi:hypothetical protein
LPDRARKLKRRRGGVAAEVGRVCKEGNLRGVVEDAVAAARFTNVSSAAKVAIIVGGLYDRNGVSTPAFLLVLRPSEKEARAKAGGDAFLVRVISGVDVRELGELTARCIFLEAAHVAVLSGAVGE